MDTDESPWRSFFETAADDMRANLDGAYSLAVCAFIQSLGQLDSPEGGPAVAYHLEDLTDRDLASALGVVMRMSRDHEEVSQHEVSAVLDLIIGQLLAEVDQRGLQMSSPV